MDEAISKTSKLQTPLDLENEKKFLYGNPFENGIYFV